MQLPLADKLSVPPGLSVWRCFLALRAAVRCPAVPPATSTFRRMRRWPPCTTSALTGSGRCTDARSFLAHGIPAITLMARFEHGFARGLHSARDSRDRLSEAALERTVALLEEIVARVDARPGLLEPRSARR